MQGRDTFHQGPEQNSLNNSFGSKHISNDPSSEHISGGETLFGRPSTRRGTNRTSGSGDSLSDQVSGYGSGKNTFNQSHNNVANASNTSTGSAFDSAASDCNQTRGRVGSSFNSSAFPSKKSASRNNSRVMNQSTTDNPFLYDTSLIKVSKSKPPVYCQPQKNSASSKSSKATVNRKLPPKAAFKKHKQPSQVNSTSIFNTGNASLFNNVKAAPSSFNTVNTTPSVFGVTNTIPNAFNAANTPSPFKTANTTPSVFARPNNSNSFNQAIGNTADKPSPTVFAQSSFNTPSADVINSAFNPKPSAFGQTQTNSAFNQASRTTVAQDLPSNAFNQQQQPVLVNPAFNQAFESSVTSRPNAFNTSSTFNTGNANPSLFNAANATLSPFNAANTAPRPFNATNATSSFFNATNVTSSPFNAPNAAPRPFNATNAAPSHFNATNAIPSPFNIANIGSSPFNTVVNTIPSVFGVANTMSNAPNTVNTPNPFKTANTTSSAFNNTTTSSVFAQLIKSNASNQAIGNTDKPSPSAFTQNIMNGKFNQATRNLNKPSQNTAFTQETKASAFSKAFDSTPAVVNKPKQLVSLSQSNEQQSNEQQSNQQQSNQQQSNQQQSNNENDNTATRGSEGVTTVAKQGGETTTLFTKTLRTKEAPPKEAGTTAAADRAARCGSTSKSVLYDQLKKNRIRERQRAIEQGLILDPNNPTRLENAIDFKGTCLTKCPNFEMLKREIQNGLDLLEMDENANMNPEKVVKACREYYVAGVYQQPLPSDVRSPKALIKTLDYLVDEVISNNPLEKCHAFVRDRTRSIRQDFTLQNIRDITAVQLHERIVRFHILSIHEMCELDENKFSKQQETEQLRKVLVSLMEFYDDLRKEKGIETENEAEFRTYHIISHIKDQDVARQTMTLPANILKNPLVTRVLEFRALSQRNNEIKESSSRRNKPENVEASQNFYSSFFKLVADPDTSFLMACMLETHFSDIRKGALKAMNLAYMMKAGGVQAEDARQVLAYDSVMQLIEEAQLYGLTIDNSLGVPTIRFSQKHYKKNVAVFVELLSNPPQKKSFLLVESKKAGRNFRDIINGFNPDVVPLPNQNIFAPRSDLTESNGILAFKAQVKSLTPKEPTIVNAKPLDIITAGQEFVSNVQTDDIAKSKLAAAEESIVGRKRKESEELEEDKILNKRLELAKRNRTKLVEDARTIKEKQLQEQLEKQKEQERMEFEQKQQAMIHEQREKKSAAAMRLNIMKLQVLKAAHKIIKTKRIALPWLARARSSIAKRNELALSRKRKWHFNMHMVTHNPYINSDDTIYKAIPKHATPEGVNTIVDQSIQAEEIALDDVNLPRDQDSIWKAEEFPLDIYPRIRDKMIDFKKNRLGPRGIKDRPTWQLIISTPDDDSESSVCFQRKFGLEDPFLRKDGLYQEFNITLRMTTPQSSISCNIAEQLGAVIFSLPDSKSEKNKEETDIYWEKNKRRLDKLTEDIQYYNPGWKAPFLFTYFPDSSSTEQTLKMIPELLGLKSNRLVSDFHILIMNPATIPSRIQQEVNWLSNNTLINQFLFFDEN